MTVSKCTRVNNIIADAYNYKYLTWSRMSFCVHRWQCWFHIWAVPRWFFFSQGQYLQMTSYKKISTFFGNIVVDLKIVSIAINLPIHHVDGMLCQSVPASWYMYLQAYLTQISPLLYCVSRCTPVSGLQVSLYFRYFLSPPIFPYIVYKCPIIPIILLFLKFKII